MWNHLLMSFFFFLIYWFEREREEGWERGGEKLFVVPLIYAFIGCFLYVPCPWNQTCKLGISDNTLTNWTTLPGPGPFEFFLDFLKSSPEDMFTDFREKTREREKKHQLVCPGHTLWPRMEPAAYALTRNRTHNLLEYRRMFQPTELPGQGWLTDFWQRFEGLDNGERIIISIKCIWITGHPNGKKKPTNLDVNSTLIQKLTENG